MPVLALGLRLNVSSVNVTPTLSEVPGCALLEPQRPRHTATAMALPLTVQALAAILLSGAQSSKRATPAGDGHRKPPATGRRRLAAGAVFLASQLLPAAATSAARAFDFDLRITVAEQSSEEAEAVVKAHARNLVRVKGLIDARSWRELQAALRSSASNLKQDLYAIIQASPASRRPELRRLYSDLFNSVTSLDYAARDKDELRVQEYYSNMITSLDEIFSKIM